MNARWSEDQSAAKALPARQGARGLFWFLANFLFGAIPVSLGVTDATVAWEAHIGGFLVGLLAFRWFDPPAPPVAIPR